MWKGENLGIFYGLEAQDAVKMINCLNYHVGRRDYYDAAPSPPVSMVTDATEAMLAMS